jgi:hypothetical protein
MGLRLFFFIFLKLGLRLFFLLKTGTAIILFGASGRWGLMCPLDFGKISTGWVKK